MQKLTKTKSWFNKFKTRLHTIVYPITISQISNYNKYVTRKTINENAVTYLIIRESWRVSNSLKDLLWACYNGNVLNIRHRKREPDWFPLSYFRGENRIRTCEPVLPVTRFPGVPLQPLEHLSLICGCKGSKKKWRVKSEAWRICFRLIRFNFFSHL